jgi:hypothetical protein
VPARLGKGPGHGPNRIALGHGHVHHVHSTFVGVLAKSCEPVRDVLPSLEVRAGQSHATCPAERAHDVRDQCRATHGSARWLH